MKLLFLIPLLAGVACVLPHRAGVNLPRECPGPDSTWHRFAATDSAGLAGTYRLITVTTSFGRPDVEHGVLRLVVADSATRYGLIYPRLPRSPRNNRPLVDTYNHEAVSDPARTDSVEVQDGRLYIGCRHCLDADPSVYAIEWSGASGFGGTWRDYQTGIVRAYGPLGPTPDPAGHFCALRR
jgi:hypothetical protein